MPSEVPASRRPRADAERNRRRILDAARQVFADHGPAATLADVAKAAGVGIGTVYRKYPDKQAVLDALLEDKLDRVMRIATDAAAMDDPGTAFRSYLMGMIEVHALDRSLATVLFGPGRYDRFPPEASDRLGAVADGLIAEAVKAGELRSGFTRQDTIALAVMASAIALATRDVDPELWRRYALLIVDGTRNAAASSPLTPAPPAFREMTEAIGQAL